MFIFHRDITLLLFLVLTEGWIKGKERNGRANVEGNEVSFKFRKSLYSLMLPLHKKEL